MMMATVTHSWCPKISFAEASKVAAYDGLNKLAHVR